MKAFLIKCEGENEVSTYSLCSVDLFKLLARFQGPVWAAIVDHDDLEVEVGVGEGLDEQPDDDREVFFLIVGWQQHAVLVAGHLCNSASLLHMFSILQRNIWFWQDVATKMHCQVLWVSENPSTFLIIWTLPSDMNEIWTKSP